MQAAAQPIAPPGLPAWITPEAIADTLQTFQPFYDSILTVDDAVGILLSAGQVFRILKGKDREATTQANNDIAA